jgi:EmrB/QacA subfamily drug resistance transporter
MNAPPASGAPLTKSEINWIFAGLVTVLLLAALDQTIVATAMPTIGRELGDIEHLPWIVTAYLLAATAATPLTGKLSDIHGRRIVLLCSLAIFLIGSVACALAPTLLILTLARGLQGLGGGGLISLSQTVIADIVTPRERAGYQIYIAGVFMVSSLAGPALGGFLAEHWHWPMIFWINLPLGLAAFFMVNRYLKRLPWHGRKHRVDIAGAVLLVAATTSLLLALSQGSSQNAWTSPEILGLFAVSALCWLLLVARLRSAAEPLIPINILANNVMLCATLAASLSMGTFIGLTISMPIYFEEVTGLTASQSGLALLPLMGGTVCGATLSGRLMIRLQHYKRIPLCGLAVAFCTVCYLAAQSHAIPMPLLALLLGLTSTGLGTVLTIATVSVQNNAPLHQLGTATATMNLFRQLGAALIVAVFGAIILNGAGEAPAKIGAVAAHLQPERLESLIAAYRLVFLTAAAGFAIAFLAFLRMEERPLGGHHARTESPAIGE